MGLIGVSRIIIYDKRKFPKNAIDISESLELLLETIDGTMDNINQEITDAYKRRNFNEVRKLLNCRKISLYEEKLEN